MGVNIKVHIIYVYECVNTYLPPSVSICFNFNPHLQLMKMKMSIILVIQSDLLGWLSDLLKRLSDLQLGDERAL